MNRATFRAAVVFKALLLPAVAPMAVQASECLRVPTPDLSDAWIFSVARANGSILAVDSPGKRVMEISPRGDIVKIFGGLENHKADTGLVPVVIQAMGGNRFLLGNGVQELLEVTPGSVLTDLKGTEPDEQNLRVLSESPEASARKGSRGEIIGLFSWGATADGHVLAFVDVANPDGTYTRGLAWFERSRPDMFQIVREVEKKSDEATFYFVLHPFIATIGDKAYFLAMGEHPTIYEYDGLKLRALGLPKAFRDRPFVPEKQGPKTIPEIYAELEHATTPVALYAWKGDLWLLGRRPRIEGGTHWTLSRIRPNNNNPGYESKLLYTLHLPTGSEHLAIAVGDDYWTALEKDGVAQLGRQPIKSMVRLPGEWLANGKESPLRRLNLSLCR